jgi:hypothetical protein
MDSRRTSGTARQTVAKTRLLCRCRSRRGGRSGVGATCAYTTYGKRHRGSAAQNGRAGGIEDGCAGTSGRYRALGIEHTSGSCSRHESWERALGRRRSAEDDVAEGALAEFVHNQGELFPAEQARIVQLLVERVDVQENALEVRIRAEGHASLVGELRQQSERMAA